VKIGDFGLSRDIYAKHYYKSKNKVPLPLKWMAIECIQSGFYSTETDVWSFGVLIWEILSRGSDPYPFVENLSILSHIKSGNRLPKPIYCSEDLYKLLTQCWSASPKYRPTFPYLLHFISIIIDDMNQEEAVNSKITYSVLNYSTISLN